MRNDPPSYDTAAVRDLLLAAFTADDLRRLIVYTSKPALRPLVHEFSAGDGLMAMIEKAITYCHKQDCLPDLLAEVEKANPRQYARFENQLEADDATAQAPTTPAAPPATVRGGTTYVTHIRDARGLAIGDGARVIIASEDDHEGDAAEQEP